jgi:hypothetical protein
MIRNIQEDISSIKSHFSYLETDFGYKILEPQISNRYFSVKYQKEELLAVIFYSLANHWVEITIYNHISKVPPGRYSWRYSIPLDYLMQHRKQHFDLKRDYESHMPKNNPNEDFFQQLAFLFKEYAKDILEGKEWVSWGDISGYDQFVPDDLP